MTRPLSALILIPFVTTVAAQCIVDNPGGIKASTNRPADADVPVATISPLSRVNESLPRWLCFTVGYRARFEGYDGGSFRSNNSDTYLLTRFRLGLSIRPASWFKLYAELQDATAFWRDSPLVPPYQSTWDLRRAYVDFGDTARGISFRVGRQDLNFGNGRLVGTSYWRNASRGYDAAMMVWSSSWLTVNTFAASPVIAVENGLSHHVQGNNLHGVYGGFKKLIPGSVVEPYIFWRLSPRAGTEQGSLAKMNEKTGGIHWAGRFSGWEYDAETVFQRGNVGPEKIRAWAGTLTGGYNFDSLPLRPRIVAGYAFASGDRNPQDGTHGTFDQLYPNIHDHHGLADQVAWQNLKEIRSGVRISLRHNWTLSSMFCDWWLAKAADAFYSSSGAIVARDPTGKSGSHIGTEFDLETAYRVNRQLEFAAGLGQIFPGDFLTRTSHNSGYRYPYVMLYYNAF
jgi:hypothetical protein